MRSAVHARAFAGLAAVLAAVAITATAAAATTYQLTGVETAATATTATFQGVLGSPGGTWQGVIVHEALDKSPHGVTAIVQSTSGGFVIIPAGATPVFVSITGGQLVAMPAVGGKLCTQQFRVDGSLVVPGGGTGSFQGILTHYGAREHGVCNASFASFTGSVTLP